ncbi:MAG: MGMT family protein [Chitinophagaceae bacterium]
MEKSNFFQDVWDVARLVPKGRVTSYGAIARYLGAKNRARMVGWAMAAASSQKGVPAWRVVNSSGVLTGSVHFETPTKMQELLASEGIVVKDNKIVDFKKAFWNPEVEL